eukprot:18370-Heterococcus_DN1.PRE.1
MFCLSATTVASGLVIWNLACVAVMEDVERKAQRKRQRANTLRGMELCSVDERTPVPRRRTTSFFFPDDDDDAEAEEEAAAVHMAPIASVDSPARSVKRADTPRPSLRISKLNKIFPAPCSVSPTPEATPRLDRVRSVD